MHGNVEQLARRDQLVGHGAVVGARGRVAARVVNYSDPFGLCPKGSQGVSARGEGLAVIVVCSDGSEDVRAGGSRAWRNSNPGNMENGDFAKAHGSIGGAGGPGNKRFAVFADGESGFDALVDRLGTGSFTGLPMDAAIERWAPPSENNTARYKTIVQKATGLSGSTRLGDMTAAQREALARAIRQHEGWIQGTVTNRSPSSP